MKRNPFSTSVADVLNVVAMLAMTLFFAAPVLWLVSLALRDRREVYMGAARLIPKNPTIQNFITVLGNASFPGYLWNGLLYACVSAVGVLIVAAPAAYAFSRIDMRGKPAMMMGILAVQMISPMVIMIPIYRYIAALGLLDNAAAVIMVYIALGIPFAVWMIKGAMDGIPRALDEAAMIDGCGRFEVFRRILVPLSTPIFASVFIITVIGGWSQFLVPFLLTTREQMIPIAVGIFRFAGAASDSSPQTMAAACLISVVPAIAAFLALQRLILEAMTAGAVKG